MCKHRENKCSSVDTQTQSFGVNEHRCPSLITPSVSDIIHMGAMNHSNAISKDSFLQIHMMGLLLPPLWPSLGLCTVPHA